MSIDDLIFNKEPIKRKEQLGVNMSTQKKVKESPKGVGLDVGTGTLLGSSYINKKQISFTLLRDCFYTIDEKMFNKTLFNKSQMKFVKINNTVHILGEDALTLAKIQNASVNRPMAKGIINPNERQAAPILKEMINYCIKNYKQETGETLVYSIPGTLLGKEDFNVEYHSLSLQSLIQSLGYTPVALNEGYAVIVSELEKAKEVTGLGFSFGAGLVNVAFAYKGMELFNFSINKSGDFIDQESSRACGVSESMMNHIKETQLDLTKSEFDTIPEERALIFTYRHVIMNAIRNVIEIFNDKDNVNIIEPVPVIVSGGTTLAKGFMEMFKDELEKMTLPFEITKVIPAKDRLSAVSRGCTLWARQLEENKQ
jgi:actin-like ATPase involved in cell morphogenesis